MPQRKSTPKRPKWEKAFLEALALTGVVFRALDAAKIDRARVYKFRHSDEQFAAAWDRALADASDLLIEEARRRAYNGTNEPVIYQGELMGQWVDMAGNPCSKDTPCARLIPLTVTKYSDTLLMFIIKGSRPEYRETFKAEVTGKNGGPVEHKHDVADVLGTYRHVFDRMAGLSGENAESNGNGQHLDTPHANGKAD